MVIHVWQKFLECPICQLRGGCLVHATTLGTTSTTSHEPPVVHAVQVQNAVLDAL